MRYYGKAFVLFLCAATVTGAFANDIAKPVRGQSMPEFSLKDFRGKPYALSDYQSSRLIVVAVLGTECPVAKQCALKLQKIADEYAGQSVTVLAIDANRQDSLAEIAAFVKANALTYPILKDVNQQVIDALNATRTPELFVLDANRTIRYRGRIDDQFAVGGKFRKSPTRDDLKMAIDELLAGKPVSVPETATIGCLIGRAREPKTNAEVTYSNQISRLIQERCIECHRPHEIAPFSLTDYQEAAGWADMMAEVTRNAQMPPWHASPEYGHFSNARRLTPDEVNLFQAWAAAGAPEGNPADLPPPRTFTEGWQLPREPDHVVWMSDEPTQIPAEGTVDYRYFVVDSGLTEDKWITAAEVIPGNRAVVHHVIVFMATDDKIKDDDKPMVRAYVPGYRTEPFPKGMAKKIPKGSKFIFQMHYTPNGVAGEDRTKIGLTFADPTEVTHEIRTAAVINRRFKIEPEKDDQAFETRSLTLPIQMQLLSLSPHMHLRGKSFRYEVTLPDGSKETLLDVPHYDFNWQTSYNLDQPRTLPQGAKIQGFAAFDNSTNNIANPDSSKTVTWGEQSWDEMVLGYFDLAVPRSTSESTEQIMAAVANVRDPREIVTRIFELLDKDKDEKLSRDEVGQERKPIFDKLDTDKDGFVTKAELTAGLPELAKLMMRR